MSEMPDSSAATAAGGSAQAASAIAAAIRRSGCTIGRLLDNVVVIAGRVRDERVRLAGAVAGRRPYPQRETARPSWREIEAPGPPGVAAEVVEQPRRAPARAVVERSFDGAN